MVYEPDEEEKKMIQNLNDAYTQVVEGLSKIKENLTNEDGEISVYSYQMAKNFEKIYKRVYKLLEEHYISEEFKKITDSKDIKGKNRLDKED